METINANKINLLIIANKPLERRGYDTLRGSENQDIWIYLRIPFYFPSFYFLAVIGAQDA